MTSPHPLNPMTAEEMTAACAVVRDCYADAPGASAALAPDLRFPVVALHEPDRAQLRSWRPNEPVVRRAEVVVIDRADGALHEAVVDLGRGAIDSWRHVPGARPVLLFEDSLNAIVATKQHPGWQEALRRRGVTDLGDVQIDPWPAGNFGSPDEQGRRLLRCVSYVRHGRHDNGYAHPIEGVVAVFDAGLGEIIDLIEDDDVVPVPPACAPYAAGQVGPVRSDLRPLEITQPDGPSFDLDGHEITWQRWRLRFSVHPIEGLVLHCVGYEDGGRVRPILHRASIAEMVVPYGATGTNHWWKNAFDAGEWGLGRMIQPLALGCDCLGEIRYVDAVLPDDNGGARLVPNAVCIHEEDFGVLWKHVDLWTGTSEVRRSRRLVVSSISTVGNYEYGFYWYFYLDGTIQLEVKLTGILQTAALPASASEPPENGALLAPGLWGPIHQHLFCARLDVEVDGPGNSVYELDTVAADSGNANPRGNGIVARATLLDTESAARRYGDASAARKWMIVNPGRPNAVGQAVAYALVPASGVCMLADPESSIARRAAFATRNLWVTPADPDQRRPAGEHPNQSTGGDGLPAWTLADRSIVNTELVVWHTFGVSHVPRPEDFPVMPVEYTGFTLRPVGFFDRNPALDLPPSADHCR